MGDNNKPIEESLVNITAGVAVPAPTPTYGLTTIFITTSTTTSIPSITSSEAASTTTKPILAPATKPLKKQAKVNTAKKNPTAASSKPPAKKIQEKKKVVKGKNPSKKAQLVWLKASSEAFLEYLKLLIA